MEFGILGLELSGKTTIFSLLTGHATAALRRSQSSGRNSWKGWVSVDTRTEPRPSPSPRAT